MILELDLEAVTDLCLSSDNHTLGQAETHDFIPGRSLWGAVASLAYRTGMDESTAFRLFHQGAIRFLDACPMLGESRSYPTPTAWHRPKEGQTPHYRNFVLPEVREKCVASGQHKGAKGGWISPVGEDQFAPVKLKQDYSLRTAVNASGKARQGLLFGLPVLRAGSRFWTAVSGSEADLVQIRKLIIGRELCLGRSRNAELGVVKVRERAKPIGRLQVGNGPVPRFSVLCVSRCVFRDANGSASLRPDASHFSLEDGWILDLQHSFLRTTNAVHFNSKRGRPEGERFAIERGSVLTFCSSRKTVELSELATRLRDGVGEHRGQGYGEVLLAPRWLTADKVSEAPSPERTSSSRLATPQDELFTWAKGRSDQKAALTGLHREAVEKAASLRKHRVPPAQWGVLRRMAREARFEDPKALFDRLFAPEKGFVTTGQRRLSKHWRKAGDELKSACSQDSKPREQLAIFLELLAGACARPGQDDQTRRGEDR